MENIDNQKQGFDFKKFIDDSKNALLNPKEYFANMPTSGGFGEPIIKALIYGFIIGVFALLWGFLNLRLATGPAWLGGGIGILAFFGSLISSLLGLFIGGVIMLILSAILSGNTDYEANVRVVVSLMVISVISNFLSFFNGVNLYLGALVSIAVSVWGLYMTYHALVETLKAKEQGSKIVMIILAVFIAIASFTGIAAKKMTQSFLGVHNLKDIDKMSDKEKEAAAYKMIEKMTGGEVSAEDVKEAVDEMNGDMAETMENAGEAVKNTFVVEMADGTNKINPDEDYIKSSFDNINDENNFITLGCVDGFIQAAFADNGDFVIEYKDKNGHYEATELQSKDNVITMFVKYLNKDNSYIEVCEWEEMK
jgi:hypothetical protein